MPSSWDHRIARAGELQEKHPAASELLKFYQQLARFQKGVYEKLASLREHDVSVLLPFFPQLIAVAKRAGAVALAQAAGTLEQDSEGDRLALLESIWQHQVESRHIAGEDAFFAQALLQPYAEYLSQGAGSTNNGSAALCPFCGSKPLLVGLRPAGRGAQRFLFCSLCFTQRAIRRCSFPDGLE